MSLIGAMYPATAPPPVDAAPTTTVWSPPGRTESGLARVREATAGELEAWDTLIARFWNHRVTHRRSWIESLAGSGCGQPLYLVWEKRDEVVGCMPGLLARVGLWRGFGSPLPGWQTVSLGPVWDRRRVSARELLALLVPYLQLVHHVSYIELMTSDLAPALMRALGFRGEPAPTFRAALYPDDEQRTFRSLKDSARRNVRRAERLGLLVRTEEDESFVDEHYDQLREVYLRGGNAVPFSRRRVHQCFRHMKQAGRLVAVSVRMPDDTCIATGTFFVDPPELHLWMWAHRTRYRWYRPTELMTWTVMQRALRAGCVSFDLNGEGVFKEKFGAVPDLTKHRWVLSNPPWLTSLRFWAERGYRLQQAIRGHVARLVGAATHGRAELGS
ncbi:MAG TPA: GNAT family N-acetyltransferase [Gemmatimonadales bacterium]|nr:GNAT family N-acetyltransferase [Gemmatimonadales bacterium]